MRLLSARRGFTLVEALVASALVGVLGLAVAATLRAAHDADVALRGRAERRAVDRVALQAIARDLRSVVPAGGIYASGITGSQGQVGGDTLLSPEESSRALDRAASAGTEAPPVEGRDTIAIAVLPSARRFGATTPLGTGAIEQIVYVIDDDAGTPERGLVRLPTRIRDPLMGSDPEPAEEIAAEVVGLRIRYWDGTAWQDTWDSGASDTLPRAVEVAIAVRDQDGTVRRATTVVAPLTARPSELVQPATGEGP